MTRPTPPDRSRRLGNPSHRPLRVIDGAGWDLPPLGVAPDHLGPAGLAAWAIMERCAWICGPDGMMAQLFADLLDRRAQLHRLVDADPLVKGSTGQLRLNPAASFLLSTEVELEKLARLLLLTPDDRQRLGVGATGRQAAKSKLEELLDRKRQSGA